MRHIEFLRDFPKLELRPFYIFSGQETLPVDRFLEMLLERTGARGIKRFYGDEHGPGDVIAGSFTGLFGESFIALVTAAEKMKNWSTLLSAAFMPERPLVMIFERELKKKEDPFKFLSKGLSKQENIGEKAYLVELPPLDEATFTAWVARQLKSLGVRTTPDTLRELVESLPRGLRRAKNELVKLSTYLGEEELRSREQLNNILSQDPEAAEYRITDSAISGKTTQVLRETDNGMAVGMKPDILIGSIGKGLSAMAWAKLGQKNMVRPSWKTRTYEEMARFLTERDTLTLIGKSLRREMGTRRGLDPYLCLVTLLLELRK
ncbi:MAG: DNA polymerase III subunit delta [candidate division WOR-3 bacterium]